MSPIKDLQVLYEALNKEGTFSEGDTVAGTVSFTLTEETKVKGVVVKIKGEARVHWSEGTGDRRRTHSDHRRYFKDKKYLVEEDSHGEDFDLETHTGRRSERKGNEQHLADFHTSVRRKMTVGTRQPLRQ